MEGLARRRFERRYTALIRYISQEYPSFWSELGDLVDVIQRDRCAVGSALIREWPAQTDAAVQATPSCREVGGQRSGGGAEERRSPARRGRGTGEAGDGTGKRTREGENNPGTDAPEANPDWRPARGHPEGSATTAAERQPIAEERGERRTATLGLLELRGSPRYSACPRPRGAAFCFGCGTRGVTLKECPRCRSGWEELGPYHPERVTQDRRRRT